MKTLKYLFLPVIFLLSSCYIYKPYTGKEDLVPTRSDRPGASTKSLKGNDDVTDPAKSQRQKKEDQSMNKGITMEEEAELKQKEAEKKKEAESKREQKQDEQSSFTGADGTVKNTQVSDKVKSKDEKKDLSELTIKDKLKPNRYYKVTVFEKQYKIQVDKWEGDSLVAHKIRNPEKQYKFHQNDIDGESLLERRFSKPFSDLLTVGAYAVGGAAVLLLVL